MTTAAVIVAAGRGARLGLVHGAPKQYALIGGEPVLRHTVRAFLSHANIDHVVVVIHPDDPEHYWTACRDLDTGRLLPPVPGGATRQASVHCGLEALVPLAPDRVLIHDAARPFVDPTLIDRVIAGLAGRQGAVPALAVADTMKRTDTEGCITGTVDRAGLWRAQTPQAFGFVEILAGHQAAAQSSRADFTDDAALAEWLGLSVGVVEGSERNQKITTAEDLVMAERALSGSGAGAPMLDVRTGQGFDVHRFTDGDHVWLGGLRIAHTHCLEGHSDADVALHALTDALLGAIGDGDIGQHFPPSDLQWKGAASHLFLADAARRVRERGGRIGNVDLTILCEAPRIGPHREAMRQRIADILEIEISRVGVKATTTEGLGFTGRREGIAAMATATVILEG